MVCTIASGQHVMATKPVVLPEPFCGETSREDWEILSDNVAEDNGWDDEEIMKCMAKGTFDWSSTKCFSVIHYRIQGLLGTGSKRCS